MDDKMQELKEIEVQRGDIITKLKKIEEKKDNVSTEVYEKVKGEYEGKLQALNEKMTEHKDLIQTQLQEINQEEQTAADAIKKLEMQLEEIELRYSIGEHTEDDYQQMKQENEQQLNSIKEKMQSMNERKKWLGNFIESEGAGKEVEQQPAPVPETEPSAQETSKDEAEAAIDQIKEVPEKESKEAPEKESKDDIQIEEHILEEKLPDEDTKLEELIVEEEAVAPVTGESTEDTTEEKAPEESAPAQEDEKDKSIACPKCGHMNTPDSWYCEKCGAEILDSPIS